MCIIFIAVRQHPRYPLIIAANRDEFHARPSAPLHRWRDCPGLLAGRDNRAGGAWFGVHASGRIAAVTNHRAAGLAAGEAAQRQSRGRLVAEFLAGDTADTDTAATGIHPHTARYTARYTECLRRDHAAYRPFNLLYGGLDDLWCFSSAEAIARPFGVGFHSLSNGDPHEIWPKMSRGIELLKTHLARENHSRNLSQTLAAMMRDQRQAADHLLPDTGLNRAREKHLSSIFITAADYGSRATTLLFGDQNAIELYEYNYAPDGTESTRRHAVMEISTQNKSPK